MAAVAEHEERPGSQVLAQPFAHQGVQAVEALAHVARFQRHPHLQASRETQHAGWALASNARSNPAARFIWAASEISMLAPPGSATLSPEPHGTSTSPPASITASTHRVPLLDPEGISAAGAKGVEPPPLCRLRLRICRQWANV